MSRLLVYLDIFKISGDSVECADLQFMRSSVHSQRSNRVDRFLFCLRNKIIQESCEHDELTINYSLVARS